ncbi:HPF/RaiA family ribosome-associated protein [Patiriisocius hiemis]|uniref:HPF/RaiA family ribosome-associated protein n=1 Tax=Patiriisocius hiemis TaxID=3075604 RepID=A0ABU2YES2_9FLAO|nr:HPF/RaiA family ribosome-associated protein [Constantimarinum sp. W242]MDT0556688.1 HPF/RaiA family ribosome-associated protein [Constantimarinum sp. W242]
MKLNVQTPNFSPKSELLSYIDKRFVKLQQFHDKIVATDVFMKVQKTASKENKLVELLVRIPKKDIVIKKAAKSFEEAVYECMQSAERQLKKMKQKERAILLQ